MEINRTTNMSKGLTGLQIPVITSEHTARMDFALPAFSKWCDTVPVADTATAAKMIFFALTELNTTAMEPAQKFALLEAMRRPLYSTVIGLKKHYTNNPNSFTKKKLMIADLAQTLQAEITIGYKTVLEDITHGKNDFDPKYARAVQVSLYRVIYFIFRRIFRSYQLYNQIEPTLWHEAHLTYYIASKLKVSQVHVGTQYTVEVMPVTVENCYKQVLILAATNPYQWRQIEQDNILNAINYWNEYVKIRPFNKDDLKNTGVYIFDPSKDQAPLPPQLHAEDISKNALILDLNALVEYLTKNTKNIDLSKEHLNLKFDNGAEYEISSACLKKILHDWSKEIKPKDLRMPTKGALRATFGLIATHFNIANRLVFNVHPEQAKTTNYLQNDGDENKPEIKALEETFPVHVCFLHDKSPGGYQIMHYSENHPIIYAGDIIGLKPIVEPQNQASTWEVGEIKWLQYTTAEKLSIGIKKISSNPLPVAAHIMQVNNQPSPAQLRCILINEKNQIITPALPFKQGQKILLDLDGGKHKKITLSKQLNAAGTFKIFEYEENQDNDSKPKDNDGKTSNQPKADNFDTQKIVTEFDDLWHHL
jgi:hypothetical protein